jgi:folate-dependent phosphoribosylglycinamide formyltransferase PurN
MRVTVISRYPRIDVPAWKRELVSDLLSKGAEVSVLYSRSSLVQHAHAGLGELGRQGAARRLGRDGLSRLGRRAPGGGSGQNDAGDGGSLANWAERHGLDVRRHERLGDPETVAGLRSLRPDIVLLAGADLVPPSVLAIPTVATINPHYGLLPQYRGMNVTEWSVYHDDPVGVTVHTVDAGVDTGDILLRERVGVEPVETLQTLRVKHQQLARRLLLDALRLLAAGRAEPATQASSEGRQFYRMHPRLRALVEAKLTDGTYHRRAA